MFDKNPSQKVNNDLPADFINNNRGEAMKLLICLITLKFFNPLNFIFKILKISLFY